jgi:rhodanese-related sulfurtransferase
VHYVFILLFLMLACQPMGQQQICHISAEDLSQTTATIIDVRTPEEYEAGHLPGAVNLDVQEPAFATEISNLDPQHQYIIYCKSGKRSSRAVEVMAASGFRKVCQIEGGVQKMTADGVALIQTPAIR